MHQHRSSRRRRTSVGTGTLALSLGLCLCAGQLISTPAANAATPVVMAAAAKAKTSIRSSVSTRNLAWGSRVRVTAKLLDPRTGKVVTSGTVRLQAYRGGKWINWGVSAKLGGSGVANLYAKPNISGYFRAQYLGNSSHLPVTGGRLGVNVRPSAAKVIAEAKKHVGALYKFAAAGPSRFDCSGYTLYVYRKAAGKSLPHKANLQQRYGTGVSKGSKRVGDLIVFRSGSYGSHVGIYAGNGYMYDSPHTGARVGKHKMYGSNYVVRRLVAA